MKTQPMQNTRSQIITPQSLGPRTAKVTATTPFVSGESIEPWQTWEHVANSIHRQQNIPVPDHGPNTSCYQVQQLHYIPHRILILDRSFF